jgi:superoxide dismutase, Cu-Zn family
MRNKIKSTFGITLLYCLFIINSSQGFQIKESEKQPRPNINKAVCVLSPTQGNDVTGIITFTKTDHGIKVVADVKGLTKGKHGFHIHEYGDCSSVDGSSAGGHFNPEGKSHGAPSDMMRHTGDMGNLEADDTGIAHLEYIDPMISFEGDHSIIGRSIIIHKSEDDLKTQPTGNAGLRVACGVIGIAK